MLECFIALNRCQPWRPGDIDCLMVLADWCVANGRRDPASHLRGTYHDEDGFREIIGRAGGVVPLVAGCAAAIGLHRAATPAVGSIAVIGSTTDVQRQWGAIWDGASWRVRMVNDYAAVKARALAIWSL